MASYCSVEDVRNVFVLGGDETDQSSPAFTDDAVILDGIRQAQAQIDAYIGARYIVPVTATAVDDMGSAVTVEPVRTWTSWLAAYLLYLTWRQGQDITATDPLVVRGNMVLSAIGAVRDGRTVIPGLPEQVAGATSGFLVTASDYVGTLFTPGDFTIGTGASYPNGGYYPIPFYGR